MSNDNTNGNRKNQPEQSSLFDNPPAWVDEWQGMPGYQHRDLEPFKSITVHFRSQEDMADFGNTIGQKIYGNQKSLWFPAAEIGRYADKRYKSSLPINPRYPVYIISKGRWESRRTSKALEILGVPYYIVVEPQEFDNYSAVIEAGKILTLPFSNLGQGSIPVRNWVWEHSIVTGAERHWVLDDNISSFMRFQDNLKCPVADGSIFRAAEDFTDRYTNTALSGFNYKMFVSRKSGNIPPYTLNTRIYSCILIKNDLPYRWRGRYNEDTDLSIRALKDGWCTILFNAFLAEKETTMTMKGGNTDELYQGDGRLKMAESLQAQHPDVVRITEKWGRPQHYVNYKIFRRNKLILKPDAVIPAGQDDYGMSLRMLTDSETEASNFCEREGDCDLDGEPSDDLSFDFE